MAKLIIPLEEAIHVFINNVELGGAIRKVDATEYGPRLAVQLMPIMRPLYVFIRFLRFENGTAWFELDGMPAFMNLGSVLKLPEGISVSGTQLRIDTGTLISSLLGMKGLAVKDVKWEGGSYWIETMVIQ